jgi:hypothetical protein
MEFEEICASLFSLKDKYLKIVKFLSTRKSGFTRQEIVDGCDISNGGNLSLILKELIECDIVDTIHTFPYRKNKVVYQLVDYFSIFYLTFENQIGKCNETFYQSNYNANVMNTWRGLSFERVCKSHIKQVKFKIGILGVSTDVYSFQNPKVQIDILIERADRIINICEAKYCVDEYRMDNTDRVSLSKRETVIHNLDSRKTIHHVIITTYGLENNQYSKVVSNVITLDDLFAI